MQVLEDILRLKGILVTGATGFIGKVLLEKVLKKMSVEI
jgi:thioester reductase-like protein